MVTPKILLFFQTSFEGDRWMLGEQEFRLGDTDLDSDLPPTTCAPLNKSLLPVSLRFRMQTGAHLT